MVYGNYYGILMEGGDDQALDNRVYDNSQAGIYVVGEEGVTVLQGNTVYSNGVGVQLEGFYYGNAQLSNNLIYANVNQGILVDDVGYGGGAQITNNTIYQPVGDAVRIQDSSRNISLKNNILWVQASGSYDIAVADDSESGFSSDYNDLMTSGGGQVALWQDVARPTLTDWQNAAVTDQNSLSLDPLFVNPAAGDFHLQSLYGSLHGGSNAPAVSTVTGLPFLLSGSWTDDAAQSPAIDRGDSASAFSNEPSPNGGYINLGSDGNTDQASKSPPSYVLVTTPSGGEVWPAAQTFPIGWRSLQAGQNALSFNGSTSYVDMGNPASGVLDLGATATLEAWVYFDGLPSNSIATIASKDAGTGNTNKWIFGYANNYYAYYNGSNYASANATVFLINNPTEGQTVLASSSWTPTLYQWYHVALVKTGDNYSFYLDGVLQNTVSASADVPAVAASFQVGRAKGSFLFTRRDR